MERKDGYNIENLKQDAIYWCDNCQKSEVGYGLFFFERKNAVTGCASLTLEETGIIFEMISENLSAKEVSLLVELMKKTLEKKSKQQL